MKETQLLKNQVIYYFKTYKGKLILLYLVTALSNLIELIPLYLFGMSLDYVLAANFKSVVIMIGVMAIIFFITMSLSFVETILNKQVNQLITIDTKTKVYEKILKLKRKNFNNINDGQILSKIEFDSSAVANFITEDIVQILIAIVTLVITLAVSIKISLKLSIIAICTFPISMILSNVLGKKTRKFIDEGKKLLDKNTSIIQETLMGIEEYKCLRMESYLSGKYKLNLNSIMKNSIKTSIMTSFINIASAIITSVGDWIIILVSSWMIIHNTLTVGTLVAFNSYCVKFTKAISDLAGVNVKLQTVYNSIHRIEDILNLTDESQFKRKFKPEIHGNITIKDVDFSYTPEQRILKKLNLEIKKNELYVIVGKNGCGKSSLLNLLLRFYEQNNGEILFDGNKIEDIDIEYLRTKICYIPQQPFIFQGTIKENLSLFKDDISLEVEKKACNITGLQEFIETLPDEYDTFIGKGGINLSGGQRQKLAIARGILRHPKIMILDEITSDLDSKAETEIMNLLNKLSKTITIITVAHRINSIVSCPNIIVMKDGEIIKQGSHQELINNCDTYIDLYKDELDNIHEKTLIKN